MPALDLGYCGTPSSLSLIPKQLQRSMYVKIFTYSSCISLLFCWFMTADISWCLFGNITQVLGNKYQSKLLEVIDARYSIGLFLTIQVLENFNLYALTITIILHHP